MFLWGLGGPPQGSEAQQDQKSSKSVPCYMRFWDFEKGPRLRGNEKRKKRYHAKRSDSTGLLKHSNRLVDLLISSALPSIFDSFSSLLVPRALSMIAMIAASPASSPVIAASSAAVSGVIARPCLIIDITFGATSSRSASSPTLPHFFTALSIRVFMFAFSQSCD